MKNKVSTTDKNILICKFGDVSANFRIRISNSHGIYAFGINQQD